MVMQKIILSPCLVCENENIYDWTLLEDTLFFINNFLDCGIDSIEGSIFHPNSWYTPPSFCLNMFNYFTSTIFPILNELLRKGDEFIIGKGVGTEYEILNKEFTVTNNNEMDLIAYYLKHINKNPLMFIGKINYGLKDALLKMSFDKEILEIALIKNPWLEETESFNKFIKNSLNENSCIFPNKNLCTQLNELMKTEAKLISGVLKGSHYKKYGKIIAYRNNFVDYPVCDPFEPETDYYIRNDGKYILSVDLIHGTFEVFYGSNELWFAEYNFLGEELEAPTTRKELDDMRQNHRIHKRHH